MAYLSPAASCVSGVIMLVGWLQGKRIMDMFTIGVRYLPDTGSAGPSPRLVSWSRTGHLVVPLV